MSRMGGESGFLGFLLRFVVTLVMLWVLTVMIAVVIMLALNIGVDVLSAFTSPLSLAEKDILIGTASLLLGWIISMAIAYLTIWRGRAFG